MPSFALQGFSAFDNALESGPVASSFSRKSQGSGGPPLAMSNHVSRQLTSLCCRTVLAAEQTCVVSICMRWQQSPPSMCRATPGQYGCVLRGLRQALPWPEPASNGTTAPRPPRPPHTAARNTRPGKNTAADKRRCRPLHHSMPNPRSARPPENGNDREEAFDSEQL